MLRDRTTRAYGGPRLGAQLERLAEIQVVRLARSEPGPAAARSGHRVVLAQIRAVRLRARSGGVRALAARSGDRSRQGVCHGIERGAAGRPAVDGPGSAPARAPSPVRSLLVVEDTLSNQRSPSRIWTISARGLHGDQRVLRRSKRCDVALIRPAVLMGLPDAGDGWVTRPARLSRKRARRTAYPHHPMTSSAMLMLPREVPGRPAWTTIRQQAVRLTHDLPRCGPLDQAKHADVAGTAASGLERDEFRATGFPATGLRATSCPAPPR